MIPKKYGPLLFSLILSGLMSLLVSGIATFRASGLMHDFISTWTSTWLTAWLFTFPAVMLVTPVTRKIVQLFIVKESPVSNHLKPCIRDRQIFGLDYPNKKEPLPCGFKI